jgi:hypothetical protein
VEVCGGQEPTVVEDPELAGSVPGEPPVVFTRRFEQLGHVRVPATS